MPSSPVIFWFRRDLRLTDHRGLRAAVSAADGAGVLGAFIVDSALLATCGLTRANFLARSVDELNISMKNRLVIRSGDAALELAKLAAECGARLVVATTDFAPYGIARDERVRGQLAHVGVELRLIDSPYIVAPGTVRSKSGEPFKVFSAFQRGWLKEVTLDEQADVTADDFVSANSESSRQVLSLAAQRWPNYFGDLPREAAPVQLATGETMAHQALSDFSSRVDQYGTDRNRPDLNGTSRLSAFLRFGVLHPRQIVRSLGAVGSGGEIFLSEIAWREFYADVLFHHPRSITEDLTASLRHLHVDRDERAQQRFRTWALGETGFPLVDAGMRQLLNEGWMHNRVRMVTASFLVKHLHLDWRWGAQWFMWRLADGDIASNQHGWQWTAGTGTDAAPFHRVFNPTLQAVRFDPSGDYVHRYVTELASVGAPECLQPGGGDGLLAAKGYAVAMLDPATERREALDRYAAAREMAVSQ